jgi:hypothetical protein
MRFRWSVVSGIFALGVLGSAAVAQETTPQGIKVWLGPSLGSRESQVLHQTFSSVGISKDISSRRNDSFQLYGDAFRVVSRPAEILPRTTTNQAFGIGLSRMHRSTDQAGMGTFYGFGVGYYRTHKTDTFPGIATVNTQSIGGKLFMGLNIDGPYFLQTQYSFASGVSDWQLGVGRRF